MSSPSSSNLHSDYNVGLYRYYHTDLPLFWFNSGVIHYSLDPPLFRLNRPDSGGSPGNSDMADSSSSTSESIAPVIFVRDALSGAKNTIHTNYRVLVPPTVVVARSTIAQSSGQALFRFVVYVSPFLDEIDFESLMGTSRFAKALLRFDERWLTYPSAAWVVRTGIDTVIRILKAHTFRRMLQRITALWQRIDAFSGHREASRVEGATPASVRLVESALHTRLNPWVVASLACRDGGPLGDLWLLPCVEIAAATAEARDRLKHLATGEQHAHGDSPVMSRCVIEARAGDGRKASLRLCSAAVVAQQNGREGHAWLGGSAACRILLVDNGAARWIAAHFGASSLRWSVSCGRLCGAPGCA